MRVLNYIKLCRVLAGLTQREVAEIVNISVNALSDIENNKYQPRVSTALRLARVFNCSVEYLFYME